MTPQRTGMVASPRSRVSIRPRPAAGPGLVGERWMLPIVCARSDRGSADAARAPTVDPRTGSGRYGRRRRSGSEGRGTVVGAARAWQGRYIGRGTPPQRPRRSRPSAVAPEVVRARPERGGLVVRVEEAAAVDGETATADAGGEPVAQGLQGGDAAIDVGTPGAGEAFPVAAARRPVGGQCLQRDPDLLERDTGGTAGLDERHPAQGGPGVAALVAPRAVGADQAPRLVEAQGGGGDAAAGGEFADRQPFGH